MSGAKPLTPEFATIPAGWFLMGSDAGQDVERPMHRAWVDAFAMAITQVTNEEYARFLADSGREHPPFWLDPNFNHPRQPVVAVSWFDAVAYCDWLSGEIGERFRLPTEPEWERAARGGIDGHFFPWGDEPPQSRPRYSERWKSGPEQVSQSEPNAYGLYEMCENVHEWCSDWFAPDYYTVSPTEIRKDLKAATASLLEEAPGATTSRSRAARHDRASRRNFSMRIMGSGW
jgi:formylglycine-generating enzyme